jgi:hypothetical protein
MGAAEPEQPLACSLRGAERIERGRHLRVLSDGALVGRSRDGCVLELRFRPDGGIRESLEELVELESRCCPFLDFEIAAESGEGTGATGVLMLRIAAPEDASGVIDTFDSLTTPREPASSGPLP